MLASSRKPCPAANPRRRARSPALQSPCKRAVTQKAVALCQTRPQADAIIGPYAEGWRSITVIHPPCPPSGLCRPFALHCRAGRSRPPRGAAARKDIGRARHRTPPSSLTRCHLPLQGRLLERQALYKASPAKGCGVERRLRRRKRDGAGLTVAERKCASAHAARCGHRKPDGRCAARCRRRGALPPGGKNVLQSPAGPCPMLRRGRCLHRPGNLAMPHPPSGGRNRPPYIAAVNGH